MEARWGLDRQEAGRGGEQREGGDATGKETYSYSKRDLFISQNSPIHIANETYSYHKPCVNNVIHVNNLILKRDLLISQTMRDGSDPPYRGRRGNEAA